MRLLPALLLLVAAIGVAQQPGNPHFLSAYMLVNPAVQDELKLSATQRALIKALTARPMRMPQDKVQKPDEIRKHFEGMARKRAQDEKKVLDSLTAPQKVRLKQITLQSQGITVAAVPEIGKELGLTADQQKQVAAMMKKRTDEMRKGSMRPPKATMSQEEMRKFNEQMMKGMAARMAKYRKMQKDDEAKIMAMLSAQQKQKWQQMLGKPFNGIPTKIGG